MGLAPLITSLSELQNEKAASSYNGVFGISPPYFKMNAINLARLKFFSFRSKTAASDLVGFSTDKHKFQGLYGAVERTSP